MIWSFVQTQIVEALLLPYLTFVLAALTAALRIWLARNKAPFTHVLLGFPADRAAFPIFRLGHSIIDLRLSWFIIPAVIFAVRPLRKEGDTYIVETLVGCFGISRREIPDTEISKTPERVTLWREPYFIKEAFNAELARRGELTQCAAMRSSLIVACSYLFTATLIFVFSTTFIIPYKDLEAPFRVVQVNKDSAAYAAGLREGATLVKADKYPFIFKRDIETYLNVPVLPQRNRVPHNKQLRRGDLVTLTIRNSDGGTSEIKFPVQHTNGIKVEYRQQQFKPIYLLRMAHYITGLNFEKHFLLKDGESNV